MKFSKTLVVFLVAAGLSTTAQANDTGIDSLLTKLVATAITVTVDEVNTEVRETIAETAHQIDHAVTIARVEVRETESEREDSE